MSVAQKQTVNVFAWAGVECGGGVALLGEYGMILQKGVLIDGPIHLYPWAFLSTSQRKPLAGGD